MQNTKLQKKRDSAVSDMESLLDEMTAYIEELESDVDQKAAKIEELENLISDLK